MRSGLTDPKVIEAVQHNIMQCSRSPRECLICCENSEKTAGSKHDGIHEREGISGSSNFGSKSQFPHLFDVLSQDSRNLYFSQTSLNQLQLQQQQQSQNQRLSIQDLTSAQHPAAPHYRTSMSASRADVIVRSMSDARSDEFLPGPSRRASSTANVTLMPRRGSVIIHGNSRDALASLEASNPLHHHHNADTHPNPPSRDSRTPSQSSHTNAVSFSLPNILNPRAASHPNMHSASTSPVPMHRSSLNAEPVAEAHEEAEEGEVDQDHSHGATRRPISLHPNFYLDQVRVNRGLINHAPCETERTMKSMDVMYQSGFYDYIRDESNVLMVARYLSPLIHCYSVWELASSLAWLTAHYTVDTTGHLLSILLRDWAPDLAGMLLRLLFWMPINIRDEAMRKATMNGAKESDERFQRKWQSRVPYLKCRSLSEIYEIISIILLNEGPNDAAAFIHAFTNHMTPLSEIISKGQSPHSDSKRPASGNTKQGLASTSKGTSSNNGSVAQDDKGKSPMQKTGSSEKGSKSSIIHEELTRSKSIDDSTADNLTALGKLELSWDVQSTTDLITFLDSSLEWSEEFFTIFTHRYISLIRQTQIKRFPSYFIDEISSLSKLASKMMKHAADDSIEWELGNEYHHKNRSDPYLMSAIVRDSDQDVNKENNAMDVAEDDVDADGMGSTDGSRDRITFRVLDKFRQEDPNVVMAQPSPYSNNWDEKESSDDGLTDEEHSRAMQAFLRANILSLDPNIDDEDMNENDDRESELVNNLIENEYSFHLQVENINRLAAIRDSNESSTSSRAMSGVNYSTHGRGRRSAGSRPRITASGARVVGGSDVSGSVSSNSSPNQIRNNTVGSSSNPKKVAKDYLAE